MCACQCICVYIMCVLCAWMCAMCMPGFDCMHIGEHYRPIYNNISRLHTLGEVIPIKNKILLYNTKNFKTNVRPPKYSWNFMKIYQNLAAIDWICILPKCVPSICLVYIAYLTVIRFDNWNCCVCVSISTTRKIVYLNNNKYINRSNYRITNISQCTKYYLIIINVSVMCTTHRQIKINVVLNVMQNHVNVVPQLTTT